MNICCHTVQRCSAFVRICQCQGQLCSGDFLLSGDVLLGNGKLGNLVPNGRGSGHLAVCSNGEGFFCGVQLIAVRCIGFLQLIAACRQSGDDRCIFSGNKLNGLAVCTDAVIPILDQYCLVPVLIGSGQFQLRGIQHVFCGDLQCCTGYFRTACCVLLADRYDVDSFRIADQNLSCGLVVVVIALGRLVIQIVCGIGVCDNTVFHSKGHCRFDYRVGFFGFCVCKSTAGFFQCVFAVRQLAQNGICLAGNPCNGIFGSVAHDTIFYCHIVQRCSAFVRICQGQGQRCSGDFLLSGDVLLANGKLGGVIFHYDLVVVLGQSVDCSDLAVSSDLEGHLLGLFGEAVRCGGFFQRVHACRQICQCHTALGFVRSPCNGVAAGFDSSSAAVAVGALDLAQVCSCRCSQFQYGSGEFFSAADCLLADRHAGLLTVLHGNVVAGNVIFCGSRCINYTVFNGKGEVCAYLVVAVRCNYLRHGVGTVRQTDDVGLVFAVRNKGQFLAGQLVLRFVVHAVRLGEGGSRSGEFYQSFVPAAVCLGNGNLCTSQFLQRGDVFLADADLRPVDDSQSVFRQIKIAAVDRVALCICGDNITVCIDCKGNAYRCVACHGLFCQGVIACCQSCEFLRICIRCPCLAVAVRTSQCHFTACHSVALDIDLCKRQFHLCGIGISNGLFARNTRQQVYPIAVAGVGSEECLAAY